MPFDAFVDGPVPGQRLAHFLPQNHHKNPIIFLIDVKEWLKFKIGLDVFFQQAMCLGETRQMKFEGCLNQRINLDEVLPSWQNSEII